MNNMNLPDGKTCADCTHYYRCSKLVGVKGNETYCDFAPSRFAFNWKREAERLTAEVERLRVQNGYFIEVIKDYRNIYGISEHDAAAVAPGEGEK
jgi:hypothetical protein